MEVHLNTGPELAALRETKFYRQLHPFIKARPVTQSVAPDFIVREEDDAKLSPSDRFYLGLDFIFGDLFRNVRTRLWIKTALRDMTEESRVDVVGSHFLFRAYLNELVIVLERLQRLIALLAKGLGASASTERYEMDVLEFFNPILFEKRNYNHHHLYMSYPQSQEIERLLTEGLDADAIHLFGKVIRTELDWIEYTEKAFAKFLSDFFDRVHDQLKTNEGYVEPNQLPAGFSLSTRLDGNLRGKHKHPVVFQQANDI